MQRPEYRSPKPDRPPVAKDRDCLKCGRRFRSRHVGERVCQPCKSGRTWRNESGFGAVAV